MERLYEWLAGNHQPTRLSFILSCRGVLFVFAHIAA